MLVHYCADQSSALAIRCIALHTTSVRLLARAGRRTMEGSFAWAVSKAFAQAHSKADDAGCLNIIMTIVGYHSPQKRNELQVLGGEVRSMDAAAHLIDSSIRGTTPNRIGRT